MKKRRSGKSKSSTSWSKGLRKGRSWNVDWGRSAGDKATPVLSKSTRYEMKWLGGKKLKVVGVSVNLRVSVEKEQ